VKSATKHKSVSVYLTEEAHARLLAAVESVRVCTGLSTVSKASVAALAMSRGVRQIIEENHSIAGVS
jgi:hypothetical protein